MISSAREWISIRKYFWKEFFFYGEWELRELSKYVKRNGISLDIGANIGIYSYFLSRLSPEVIAFEPNYNCVDRLKRLRLRNLHIETVALSDRVAVAAMRVPISSDGEDTGLASLEATAVSDEVVSRVVEVPTRRLDDYNYRNVSFIKIDVEGHEEAVISGGMDTIKQSRPVLLVEIEERHNPGGLDRISRKLSEQAYGAFYFHNGVLENISKFDANLHQDVKNLSDGHRRESRNYINNFIFLPDGRV